MTLGCGFLVPAAACTSSVRSPARPSSQLTTQTLAGLTLPRLASTPGASVSRLGEPLPEPILRTVLAADSHFADVAIIRMR